MAIAVKKLTMEATDSMPMEHRANNEWSSGSMHSWLEIALVLGMGSWAIIGDLIGDLFT
jgi:hypothetical protein